MAVIFPVKEKPKPRHRSTPRHIRVGMTGCDVLEYTEIEFDRDFEESEYKEGQIKKKVFSTRAKNRLARKIKKRV